MSQVYCIRRRRKGKHLEYADRQELEYLVTQNIRAPKKKKKSQAALAELLGVSPATMSRELQRGRIVLKDSDWREYESYSADVAQDDYDKKATHKGPGLKIGKDHALAKHIEDKIPKDKYSPDAVVMEIESGKYEFKASICTRTVYNYIDQGVFANITNKDLPREGRPKKESTSGSERHSVMLGANPSVRGQKKQMSVLNTDTGRWTALSQGSAKGAAVC